MRNNKGQFIKGHTPYNKGKKWDEIYTKEEQEIRKQTCFKKGQTPHNKKQIGDEFTAKNGYVYIKIEEPNKWVQKQRYIWEKYHGEIPKGYSIIFLDQNKTNFNINNLMMVRSKDKLVAKNKKLFSNDKELTKTGIYVAQLINKTYEIQNGGKKCQN